jgi:hypothetical protein
MFGFDVGDRSIDGMQLSKSWNDGDVDGDERTIGGSVGEILEPRLNRRRDSGGIEKLPSSSITMGLNEL